MKKIVLIGVLVLAMVGGAVVWRSDREGVLNLPPVEQQVQIGAMLMVDFGDGSIATRSAEVVDGLTAYTLLANMKEFTVEIQQYDFGVFVKSIDGYKSSAEKAWIYFVNGQSGSVAADKYMVNSGDKIEWKYLKPQE